MSRAAVFTIVSNNYLHFARVLLASAREHHPECDRFCVIVDEDLQYAAALADEFATVSLDALNLPESRKFLFRYSILEANTAVKPWAFAHLLAQGYDRVVYIDPDIELYRPMEEVFSALEGGATAVVTPHLLSPMDDAKRPTELDILRAGTYNFGFFALRDCDAARRLVAWWQGKLEYDCVVDLERGLFVDQKWMDLVPGLFPGIEILRHPGYNVAYWNIAQRAMSRGATGFLVEGQPLVFFHYSGFDPRRPESFSKHQDRLALKDLGAAANLVRDYGERVLRAGLERFIGLPYGYGRFGDGTPVTDTLRVAYRQEPGLQRAMGSDPFARPEVFLTAAPQLSGAGTTWAELALWKRRPDLQQAFLLSSRESADDFARWFADHGESCIPRRFVDAVAKRVAGLPPRAPTPRFDQTGSAEAVHHIYSRILGRGPDPEALRHFTPRCRHRAGYADTALRVFLSPESRRRGLGWRRWTHLAGLLARPPAHSATVASRGANGAGPLRSAAGYEGIHLAGPDDRDHGLWVGEQARVPLLLRGERTLYIQGWHFAAWHRQMHGRGTVRVEIAAGGRALGTWALKRDGEFEMRCEIPPDIPCDGLLPLDITIDGCFVPEAIGLGGDRRRLDFRLRTLTLGRRVLVDCRREAPLLPVEEMLRPEGINVVGYVRAESGVGESARACIRSALAAGLTVSAVDVGFQTRSRQEDGAASGAEEDGPLHPISLLHVNADQTPSTLAHLQAAHPAWNGVRIGYWHWELPELPAQFSSSFDGLAEVWTPTRFVQDAVARISPVPVFRVPHAIAFTPSAAASRRAFGLPESSFLFLVMYDLHSYQERKNPMAAIRAFRRAFPGGAADVGLVIKTINADAHPDELQALRDAVADLAGVHFIDGYLSRQQVYDLESVCDALVSLHRAEGFGLALAEMMYLGKPVVATNWSGNTDFMTSRNSCPVDYELLVIDKPVGPYPQGQHWADPDEEHAAYHMRRLVEDHDLRARLGQRAAADIRTQFAPETIGAIYAKRLSQVAARL